MRLMRLLVSCAFLFSLVVHCQSSGKVTFEEDITEGRSRTYGDPTDDIEQSSRNRTREGKSLFDLIGFGTGNNVDPYLARINQGCLSGDLAECFKSQALKYFSDFFEHNEYQLSDHVRVVRMSREVVRDVKRQPYEFSEQPRAEESEWDQLVKFVLRKAEKFVKTVSFELSVPSKEVGENRAYAPRFLDEIADEIDTLEDKKDSLFSRHQFRKLLIPMLIVLKLFKLKLLLFLPLILGLASFKKFLGFLAIVIPGLIGFFKLYKPLTQNYHPPVYNPNGIGYPYYKENVNNYPYSEESTHSTEYGANYYPDRVSFAQDLAYRGYRKQQS